MYADWVWNFSEIWVCCSSELFFKISRWCCFSALPPSELQFIRPPSLSFCCLCLLFLLAFPPFVDPSVVVKMLTSLLHSVAFCRRGALPGPPVWRCSGVATTCGSSIPARRTNVLTPSCSYTNSLTNMIQNNIISIHKFLYKVFNLNRGRTVPSCLEEWTRSHVFSCYWISVIIGMWDTWWWWRSNSVRTNQTFNIVHCTNCVSVRGGCVIPFISLFYCDSASSFIFISSLRSNYKGTVNISHNYGEVIRYGTVNFVNICKLFFFPIRTLKCWLVFILNFVKSVGVGGWKYIWNVFFFWAVIDVLPEDFTMLLYAGLFLFGWKVFLDSIPLSLPYINLDGASQSVLKGAIYMTSLPVQKLEQYGKWFVSYKWRIIVHGNLLSLFLPGKLVVCIQMKTGQ